MEILLLLSSILLGSSVTSIPTTKCNRLKIRDKYYDREILWEKNILRPYNLILHKPSNTLFFSFSAPETYSDVDFTLGYYKINTAEYQTVAGIRGGCSVAVDHASDDAAIYMGGSEGIYKFNMNTNIADFYKEKGKNIWSLFYRKNLFYISYPEQTLHVEIDGKFAVVKEFRDLQMDHFFVSLSNDVMFANDSGLYFYDIVALNTVVVNDMILVRQIVDDDDGVIYVCTNLGIFTYSKNEGLKKIVDDRYIFGLTFDIDKNFIISDGNSLARLRYSERNCEDSHW